MFVYENLGTFFLSNNGSGKNLRPPTVLPNLVESYNSSRHSEMKMAPSAVTVENAAELRKTSDQAIRIL